MMSAIVTSLAVAVNWWWIKESLLQSTIFFSFATVN